MAFYKKQRADELASKTPQKATDSTRNSAEIDPNSPSDRRPTRAIQLPTRYKEALVLDDVEYTEAFLTAKESESLELASKLRSTGALRSPNGPFVDSRKLEIEGLLS